MTTARILYWNLNNFTSEKITGVVRKRRRDDDDYDAGPPGLDRLAIILDTISDTTDPGTGAAVQPDFIVVVEVYARSGAALQGQLIDGSGEDGCVHLLTEIRHHTHHDWALVPPVVTGVDGYREGIAVYYRADRWYFLGPRTWPAAYPPFLRNRLPDRTIPAGYPYRANQPERRSAGQWQFTSGGAAGPAVNFPAANNRKPWLTAFGRVGDATTLVRLMAVHTTPNDRFGVHLTANQGTTNLADIWDMTARPLDAANQIDVILGDFNVDNLDANNWLPPNGPFARLIGVGPGAVAPPYAALIRPPAGLGAQYRSYYHTHGRPSYESYREAVARIVETTAAPPYWRRAGQYPGQDYSNLSIDNALVRYRGGAPVVPDHHTTIAARARRQPYDAPAPVPVPAPMLGYYGNLPYMDETIGEIYQVMTDRPHLVRQYDFNSRFREWTNYGKVESVSDHFALLFEV